MSYGRSYQVPDYYRPPGRPSKPASSAFTSTFPELSFTADEISNALDRAYEMHSRFPTAVLYLAAHLLVIGEEHTGKPDGGSGEVTAETSVGSKRAEYAAMAESGREAFFTRTSYGRHFLALEKRIAVKGMPFLLG